MTASNKDSIVLKSIFTRSFAGTSFRPNLAACLVFVFVVWQWGTGAPEPLSNAEERLVGEWFRRSGSSGRVFSADRTFETTNGQFVGVWKIVAGSLMVTYWEPPELSTDFSLASIRHSLHRFVQKDTCIWMITFAEGGQEHCVEVPKSQRTPDGRWIWCRVADR